MTTMQASNRDRPQTIVITCLRGQYWYDGQAVPFLLCLTCNQTTDDPDYLAILRCTHCGMQHEEVIL